MTRSKILRALHLLAPFSARTLPLLALAALAIGCGKNDGPLRATASGKVSLDGAPLRSGVVRFVPSGNTQGPVAAATVKDGAFQLPQEEGPVAGTHRIEIEMIDHWGFAPDDEAAFVRYFESQPRRQAPPNPIPEIYNRHSTLTAEVKPDQLNDFDFQLHSSGGGVLQR